LNIKVVKIEKMRSANNEVTRNSGCCWEINITIHKILPYILSFPVSIFELLSNG